MDDHRFPYVQVDGRAVAPDPLPTVLMGGFGHMTAMQVRSGRVRGLDLHLARLDSATRELFGQELDGALVTGRLRQALEEAAATDASARIYVYPPQEGPLPVTVVVVRPPAPEPAGQRLRSVSYLRPLAHLKHVGVFGQVYHLKRVAAEGFDEALLVGPDGMVAEGAITNVGFLKADTVVWPQGPSLDGITMLLLRQELDKAGIAWREEPVPLADVDRFDAAIVCNSQGIAAVTQIDDIRYPPDTAFVGTMQKMYEAVPWDELH